MHAFSCLLQLFYVPEYVWSLQKIEMWLFKNKWYTVHSIEDTEFKGVSLELVANDQSDLKLPVNIKILPHYVHGSYLPFSLAIDCITVEIYEILCKTQDKRNFSETYSKWL